MPIGDIVLPLDRLIGLLSSQIFSRYDYYISLLLAYYNLADIRLARNLSYYLSNYIRKELLVVDFKYIEQLDILKFLLFKIINITNLLQEERDTIKHFKDYDLIVGALEVKTLRG